MPSPVLSHQEWVFSGFSSPHTGLSPSALIQRASSPCAKGPVPAQDIRHSWDSDRLNRIYLSAVTQGPAFQYEPFSDSQSGKPQCLVYGPDKAAFSFDRWPDFLRNLPQLLAHLWLSHAGSGEWCPLRERTSHSLPPWPNYLRHHIIVYLILCEAPGWHTAHSTACWTNSIASHSYREPPLIRLVLQRSQPWAAKRVL